MPVVLNRLDLRGVPEAELAERLPRPTIDADAPLASVRALLDEVRRGGDQAVRELTERFDGVTVERARVDPAEVAAALEAVDPGVREALEAAAGSIAAFHATQVRPPRTYERDGIVVQDRFVPVERAGLYVPGGRGSYPSSVLMTALPARVAGVDELVLCVPPDGDTGHIATSTLAAAAVAGVDEVYAIGGVQAIAAMAFGTETIRPVDVMVGSRQPLRRPGQARGGRRRRRAFRLRRAVRDRGDRRRDHVSHLRRHRRHRAGRARPGRPGLAHHVVTEPPPT